MKFLRPLALLVLVGASPGPFPRPDRPVATIVADEWSDEKSRDNAREAEQVMVFLGARPGMIIADIGAGTGYYTVRLAPRLAPTGKVIAEDIVPATIRRLRARVREARLTNVDIVLGRPDNPMLRPHSVDAALLVHMYHEVSQPFALLWHLRAALKPGGKIAIVDVDRPTAQHGTPKALLACELAAVGYKRIGDLDLGEAGGYLAVFEPVGARPRPSTIRPCRLRNGT
jgi:ubiquinone/menaquinone biosynthesis C-methylase UbiE